MQAGLYGLWSDEALAAIEEVAMGLLADPGVKVPSPAVREILLAAGCTPGEADRVRMPRAAVEAALAACPREFTQAARDSANDLLVDPDPGTIYVHNTGETAIVLDPRSGQPRPSTFADQVAAARLMHHARNQRCLIPLLSPQDVPGPLVPFYSYLALLSESDKCVGGPGVSLTSQVKYLLEMADIALGDTVARGAHQLSVYFSPVSPLQLNAEVTEGQIMAAKAGALCQVLPAPTAGTTGSASLAAGLAQQHAEVLAGVVAVQAANPGTPCTYGPRLHASDPRTGTAVWGVPVLGLCSAGATLLARRCGLACDCYGLATDADVIDAQNGYERALNGLLGASARPRYLSGVGSLHTVVAASLEQIEVDDEILGYILYALDERPWDAEALDADAIRQGILAGSFLGVRQTRKFLRREACPTEISYHGGLQEWLATGRSSVIETAETRMRRHLADDPVGLPADVEARLCDVIDRAARDLGVGEWPDPRRMLDDARRRLASARD